MRNSKFNTAGLIPGAGMGVRDMAQVHGFNIEQIRRKGFYMAGVVGNNELNISLSGTSKFLCGLLVYDTKSDPRNTLTLTINNDQRIESVSCSSLSRVFLEGAGLAVAPFREEYFPLPALLSGGKDDIQIDYNMNSGGDVFFTFYFI